MGIRVSLECPRCHLIGEDLLLYSGFSGLEFSPAWCNDCKRLVSTHIKGGYKVDESRLNRCPDCSGEVAPLDMKNPICPMCGTSMNVITGALWD